MKNSIENGPIILRKKTGEKIILNSGKKQPLKENTTPEKENAIQSRETEKIKEKLEKDIKAFLAKKYGPKKE